MATRASVRQGGRKDRPRSSTIVAGDKSKKKTGSTPDKPNTPNTASDFIQPDSDVPRKAILNDEILALQIKAEDLLKLREPKPPEGRKTTPVFSSVLVKKLRHLPENEKQKSVIVTKPAPQDAPVKVPDYTGLAGPRFDETNNIIPHSILGDVDDFVAEAVRRGELCMDSPLPTGRTSGCLTAKYEKRRHPTGYPKFQSAYRSNALKNWETKMAERRRQQNYLSGLLNKPVDHLVMNQSDEYRQIQELRHLLERTAPFVEAGSSNGIGTEFWLQPTHFGGEMTGLFTTLTETQKGYPPAILHVGVPQSVLAEKGLCDLSSDQPFRKPWHKSLYLQDRVMQLAPLLDELDPHEPEMQALEVVGRRQLHSTSVSGSSDDRGSDSVCDENSPNANQTLLVDNDDPLCDYPDVYPASVCGPSIQFGGFAAQWTGDAHSNKDQVGIEARVNFEAYAGDRTMSFLEIGNNGTAAIYYDWKKVPKEKPFNMVDERIQRFYFNQSNGVLLPGDLLKFPFIFKSPNAGVFSEIWEFQTHPIVYGGAKLLVTLRGVALKQDKYELHRAEIEDELKHKEASQVVDSLLEDLLGGIKTPERPRSPIDAYITDEELFCRRNPEVYFSRDNYIALNSLYVEALPEEDKLLPWNLQIGSVKQAILNMPDDDEQKEKLLQQLNNIVTSMSFKPFLSTCVTTYTAGCSILSQTIDKIVTRDSVLRRISGLPDRSLDSNNTAASVSSANSNLRRKSSAASDTTSANVLEPASEMRSKGKGKSETKEKKSNKDGKSPAKGKELLNPSRAGAKSSATSVQVLGSQANVSPVMPAIDVSPVLANNPAHQAKYKNMLYTQSYLMMCDMANEMELVFESLLDRDRDSLFSCPFA